MCVLFVWVWFMIIKYFHYFRNVKSFLILEDQYNGLRGDVIIPVY